MKTLNIAYLPIGNEEINVITIKDTLDAKHELVDGWLECVMLPNKIDLWINETGLIDDLDLNFATFVIRNDELHLVHYIHGNVFFASHDEEGNTVSLNKEQIDYIEEMFRLDRSVCIVS
jgi:hypothetical protein